MSIITQNAALQGLLAAHLPALVEYEGLTPEAITSAIEAGTMVLLGNPNHANVKPILVGQPSRVKVNANIGTSPDPARGRMGRTRRASPWHRVARRFDPRPLDAQERQGKPAADRV